jgi:glucosamine--fructose-6-phosphate aminotransferase (isomerizing)
MTSLMREETRTAPARVAAMLEQDGDAYAALTAELRLRDPAFVVTVARGSSDHAALYLASLAGIVAGRITASLPPSLVTRYGASLGFERAFVVSLSQSGASPDIVRTLEAARAGGAVTAAIVNHADSPLARTAAHFLPQHAGPERSVAATKSVIATMAAASRLVAGWCQDRSMLGALDRLPERLEAALQCDWTPALGVLEPASALYVVGRGPGLGVAAETALKLKETSGVLAEALSAAEIQHGPKAVIGPGFPVLAYGLDDPGGADARAFAADLVAAGASVMLVTHASAPRGALHLPLPPPLHPLLDPIVALLAFYPLVEALARRRGRDPDRPPGLLKVTRTF